MAPGNNNQCTLCPTRWTGGHRCSEICPWQLRSTFLSHERNEWKIVMPIGKLVGNLDNFSTFFDLYEILMCFSPTEQLSRTLQTVNISLQDALLLEAFFNERGQIMPLMNSTQKWQRTQKILQMPLCCPGNRHAMWNWMLESLFHSQQIITDCTLKFWIYLMGNWTGVLSRFDLTSGDWPAVDLEPFRETVSFPSSIVTPCERDFQTFGT